MKLKVAPPVVPCSGLLPWVAIQAFGSQGPLGTNGYLGLWLRHQPGWLEGAKSQYWSVAPSTRLLFYNWERYFENNPPATWWVAVLGPRGHKGPMPT